jgi:Tfp pilus assembly protein PilV
MTSTRRSRPRGLRDRLSGDGGFALIEVMVSAVLLLIIGTATLSIIDTSGRASSTTRQRAEAVGLAQQDQDAMRLMSLTALSNRNVTSTQTVGNTAFTIQSIGQWIRDATGVVVCNADASRVEYVKTTTKVSWLGHAPVVLESYVSPGVKAVTNGAVLVKLHSDAGVGTPGIPVKIGNLTATTDQGGCAAFENVTPGAASVGFDGTAGGYVDRNGNQTYATTAQSISVGSAQTNQVDALFDRSGAIPVNWVNELGATIRNVDGDAMASNAGITAPSNQTRSLTATAAGKLTGLFPFVAPYSVYAGDCTNNNPTSYLSTAPVASVVVPAGLDAARTDVLLPSLAIYVTTDGNATGPAFPGATITIKPQSGCSDGNYTARGGNGTLTSGSGPTVANLPFGQYSVCIASGSTYLTQAVNVTPYGSTGANAPTQSRGVGPYAATNPRAASVSFYSGSLNRNNTPCPTS